MLGKKRGRSPAGRQAVHAHDLIEGVHGLLVHALEVIIDAAKLRRYEDNILIPQLLRLLQAGGDVLEALCGVAHDIMIQP